MRITDLPERIGEGEDQYDLRPEVLKDLERIKCYLWHWSPFFSIGKTRSFLTYLMSHCHFPGFARRSTYFELSCQRSSLLLWKASPFWTSSVLRRLKVAILIASKSFMALNHSPVESPPELFSTAINGGSIASASFKRLLAGSDFDAPPVALSLRAESEICA
jgi:hypothetical protein